MKRNISVTRFGRQSYCNVYNGCLKCPHFARIHAQRRLRHPSMTLWTLPFQTSSKRFFSSSMLCIWASATDALVAGCPPYLVIDRTKVGAIRRPQIWRNESRCWLLIISHSITCPVCRCAVLLTDEEIAWHVAHHRQQLLRQEHITVTAAVDFTSDRQRWGPWDASGHHNRSTKCRSTKCWSDAQLVANLNFNFPQIVRQHTLSVVRYIIWAFFAIYSSFQQWKNFENRKGFDKVIAISWVVHFCSMQTI